MRTDEQIIEETNELAHYLLAELVGTGYQVTPDRKLYEADDPRSKKAWDHAVKIMEMTTKTEMADVLATLDEPEEPIEREYGVRLFATFRGECDQTVKAFSFDEAVAKARVLKHNDFNYSINDNVEGDETLMVYGPDDDDREETDPWAGEGASLDARPDGEPFSWDACQLVKDLAKLNPVAELLPADDPILNLINRAKALCTKEE